jgi:hypothetical protein
VEEEVQKSKGDDYEPATEQEMESEIMVEHEDEETPKKKKEPKPKVQDLIKAQHKNLATPGVHKDMEVSTSSLEIREPHISCLIRFVKSRLPLHVFVYCHLMPHLILNGTTLFYLNLSAIKVSNVGKINSWMAQVAQANETAMSKVPLGTASSTTAVSVICTTMSSSAVVKPSTTRPLKTKAKTEHVEAHSATSTFLEEDESAERDVALSSLIKGKQR